MHTIGAKISTNKKGSVVGKLATSFLFKNKTSYNESSLENRRWCSRTRSVFLRNFQVIS